jgi:Tol biopolymer transport system component
MEAAWPGVYVSDGAIRRTISHLRDVLDDDAQAPRYIETIPKVGYRLMASVQPSGHDERSSAPLPRRDTTMSGTQAHRVSLTWQYMIVGALVLLAGGAASVWLLVPAPASDAGIGPQVVPLTTYLGDEVSPSLSPNGTHLAFTRVQRHPDGSRRADLFVKLLNAEKTLQLTDDPAIEHSTVWSPDGAHVAFVRMSGADETSCDVYRVAAIGGAMRKLASCTRSPGGGPPALSWSPDGTQVALARPAEDGRKTFRIYGLSTHTGIARQLSAPPEGASDHDPAFAPDGQALAFVRKYKAGAVSILLESLDASDPPRVMHRQQGAVWGLHWSDDGRHLYFLTDGSAQSVALWRIARNGGVRERLAVPPEAQRAGALAVQGGHLVFTAARPQADLWRLDLIDGSSARWPFSSTRLDLLPALDPTGERIAFFSDRGGRVSLWAGATAGDEPVELAPARGTDFTPPVWLPRGDRIAYGSSEGLFVVDGATGRAQRVASMPPRNLAVAPDGVIYFTQDTPKGPHVRWTDATRSTSQRVSAPGAAEVLRHVDADSLTVTLADRPTLLLRRARAGGDGSIIVRAEALREAQPARRWVFTEDGFYYVVPGPDAAIKFFGLDTRQSEVVRTLEEGQARALTLGAGGASLIYDWEHPGGFDISIVKEYAPARQ